MRVLVTGAGGFIGTPVVKELLSAGYEVAGLLVPGHPLRGLTEVADRTTVLYGDLSDELAAQNAVDVWRPEACVHLAWYTQPPTYLHSPENITSLTNSLRLLRELIRAGCQQIVAAGTCAEYDTDLGYLREDSRTRPDTLYAATKLSFSLVAQQMAAAAGVKFAWARLFHVYGPGEDRRRLVPSAVNALLGGQSFPATQGEQVRDYIHVEDVAAAIRLLVQQEASGAFNVSLGVPVTVRQVIETIAEIIGPAELAQFGALPYRAWEPRFICGDSQRIRGLGWKPRYGLKEGLSQTVDWWRKRLAETRDKRQGAVCD
jgi:UDP-glucuronate decarboxylase